MTKVNVLINGAGELCGSMHQDDLINYILRNDSRFCQEELAAYSYDTLVLIKVRIEVEKAKHKLPLSLLYTERHHWIKYGKPVDINSLYTRKKEATKFTGATIYIGITPYLIKKSGGIIDIELNTTEKVLERDDWMATISGKHASLSLDIPIGGRIIEVNDRLVKDPTVINSFPFEQWLVRVAEKIPSIPHKLLYMQEYKSLIKQ